MVHVCRSKHPNVFPDEKVKISRFSFGRGSLDELALELWTFRETHWFVQMRSARKTNSSFWSAEVRGDDECDPMYLHFLEPFIMLTYCKLAWSYELYNRNEEPHRKFDRMSCGLAETSGTTAFNRRTSVCQMTELMRFRTSPRAHCHLNQNLELPIEVCLFLSYRDKTDECWGFEQLPHIFG